MQSIFVLYVFVISVITQSFILPSVILLSVILLTVITYAECHMVSVIVLTIWPYSLDTRQGWK